MKYIWFNLAHYASDSYLKREDLSRWEIWMGRYLLVVGAGFVAMLLFDLPLVAILVLLALLVLANLVCFVQSQFLFVLNGDPFWIAAWYVLKYTGMFWLCWRLILEKKFQTDLHAMTGLDEEDRFTHRGRDWVWLTSGPPKYRQALVVVPLGNDVSVPDPMTIVAGEDDPCSK